MFRKYELFALAAILLCLSACGQKNVPPESRAAASSQSEEGTKEEEKKPRIGVCIYKFDDDFMSLYRQELKSYMEDSYNAEVVMSDAHGDSARQMEQIRYFTEHGYDGLIINMVQPYDTPEAADLCKDAGIPVVFINRQPESEEIERWKKEKMAASYVGADASQSGTYQGEIILDTPDQGDINRDGTVIYAMIKGDARNKDAALRSQDSIKALEDAGIRTSCVFSWPGNWVEQQGYDAAKLALQNYGYKLEVIFCNNDAMAIGAGRAIEEAGRIVGKDIYLVGVDALDKAVDMVADGEMTGTVLNDHTGQSKMAADVLFTLLAGKRTDVIHEIDYVKITGISDYPFTIKNYD